MSESESALISRAKITALKYEKYCKKQETQQVSTDYHWLQKGIRSLENVFNKVWKVIMPKSLTGPSSPQQQLISLISELAIEKNIQSLPFSQLSINKAVVQVRIKIIATYTKRSLPDTLRKMDSNQEVKDLVNKKAEIIPVRIRQQPQDQVQSKLKELIQSFGPDSPYQEQVFVIWKGLFQEIVVIAHYKLSDPDLSQKIMAAIQQREDYQQLVRDIAGGGSQQQWDQSSLNKLSEQSTGIQKDLQN